MMDKFYRVEGHSQVVKNPSKGTLLNTNTTELKSARKRKKVRKENEEKQNPEGSSSVATGVIAIAIIASTAISVAGHRAVR